MKSIRIKTLNDGSYVLIDGSLSHLIRLKLGETREVCGIRFINSAGDTHIEIPSGEAKMTKPSLHELENS